MKMKRAGVVIYELKHVTNWRNTGIINYLMVALLLMKRMERDMPTFLLKKLSQ